MAPAAGSIRVSATAGVPGNASGANCTARKTVFAAAVQINVAPGDAIIVPDKFVVLVVASVTREI